MEREIFLMTHEEVKKYIEEGSRILIIPIGTLEAHGPHLPLGTDTIIPTAISRKIAETLNALIAPPIPYGVTTSLLRYHGSTTISGDTLERMLIEIITHFHHHGFDVFIILNGHGGNIEPIKNAMRELWLEKRIRCIAIHWWIFVKEVTERIFGERGAHGGVDETAMILAVNPNLVKELDTSESTQIFRSGIDVYPNPGSIILYGDEGRPRFDRELAKKYFDTVIEFIVRELKLILKKLSED